VEKVLGIGGMGVVVAATHLQLDTKVALKFLLPAMLGNQDVVARFARESRAAARIQSEHVARVLDVGTLEGGTPYTVMEFLEGEDLAAWIARPSPLPTEQAVDFVLQGCVGVASAHGIGVVHRDLKPANLFCIRGNDGQFVIKVLDFGISKVTDFGGSQSGMSGTKTATVMGSPFYMSPEQMVSAKEVDAQTDIWALGVVLYELLTKARPFAGESLPEIAIKVATASFAPVANFRGDVPLGLEAVILKCLEKDKRRRYGDIAELALALAAFSSQQSRPSIDRIVRIVGASRLSAGVSVPARSSVLEGPGRVDTITSFEPESRSAAPVGTMAPSATTAPGARGRRPGRVAAAIIGVLGVLSLAAGITWKMRGKTELGRTDLSTTTASTASSSLAPATSPVAPSEPTEPPAATGATEITPQPTVSDTTSSTLGAAPVSVKAKPNGSAHSQGQPRSVAAPSTAAPMSAAPAPSATAHSRVKCDPPYYFDPRGNRVFKPECI
jgi:serine/threonine-protein kinase